MNKIENKKRIAIIVELIPIISAIISYILIISSFDSNLVRKLIFITLTFAFFGFLFFIICHKYVKKDRIVLILGILDCLSTIYVISLYIVAIFSFGL